MAISLTCGAIGLGFYVVGASLILPFAGLEIILVATCVYFVVQRTYKPRDHNLNSRKVEN